MEMSKDIPLYRTKIMNVIDLSLSRSYLGSLYSDKGEKAKATTCFKQAAKLDGKVSDFVKQWHFIGMNLRLITMNMLCCFISKQWIHKLDWYWCENIQ